jgi:hypothetical protein
MHQAVPRGNRILVRVNDCLDGLSEGRGVVELRKVDEGHRDEVGVGGGRGTSGGTEKGRES